MEHVVVVDELGRAIGTVPKREAHSANTRLHLAFSCHVVGRDGRVLLAQRAANKPTWPLTWSNECCGHPQLGEPLHHAVERWLTDELGLRPRRLALAIPDFAYRATMADGTVEHELCPVVVAEVDGHPEPNPAEVRTVSWVGWDELQRRATAAPSSLTPWSVAQVIELTDLGWSPDRWPMCELDDSDSIGHRSRCGDGVDALRHENVGERVEGVLRAFLCERSDELAAIDPVMSELVAAIDELVAAGGKRLRPAFVYWGHRATGAPHDHAVLNAAAAIELLHTFALIHDDVIDRSATRRGRPSTHVVLAGRHRSLGRRGDDGWFGTSAAILAGDLVHVWTEELLCRGADGRSAADARHVFAALRNEVIAGQYLDLVVAADPGAAESAARRVAILKAARYTVTRPLQLGAALAGGARDQALHAHLQQYGDAVGLAFQLRDDVLGLFGDPAATGKSTLDDLREGKHTLLVLRALRLTDEHGRRTILDALGDPTLDDERAADVRSVVARSGALASIERLLAGQHHIAVRTLDAFPEPARTALEALAYQATTRAR